MSRPGITFEDVTQAAETILTQGESPTIDKVRQYLGGTGSNTTISKYLNDWRNRHFHSATFSLMKNGTPDPVKSAVERVWQEMDVQAKAEINAIKETMAAKAMKAEQKMQLVCEERDTLQQRYAELSEKQSEMAAKNEILSLDLKALQEEKVLWQERYQHLEARYAELDHTTSQHLEKLSNTHKSELARLDQNMNLFETAHREHFDTLGKQQESDRHQYMMTLDSLRTENRKKEEMIEKLQLSFHDKKIELAESRLMVKNLIKERDDLLRRISIQEKQWSLVERNTNMMEEILTHIKSLSTKNIDLNVLCVGLIDHYDNIIQQSLVKVSNITDKLSTLATLLAHQYEPGEKYGS